MSYTQISETFHSFDSRGHRAYVLFDQFGALGLYALINCDYFLNMVSLGMDTEEEKLSKTVMYDAWESGLDPEDPEVIALARKAQERKERSTWYRVKLIIKENAPKFILAIIVFIGSTVGALITAMVK